ncbi:MAG: LysR family transcriptional regulator [Candidatus Accumulibacter sp.]|jgi:DNA-binding transcriptional LysR family regulator|nr:LysR family transcriptional regulator [Accumulibacter sp.]
MPRTPEFNNLLSFIVVARERSFTRAAAQLGVSQSALSHAMRGLEERLGVRLLSRTTRGVAPTEAGERLLTNIGPYYDGIESEVAALGRFRAKPAGTVRITAADHSASTILWPKLSRLLPEYPELRIEIAINYRLVDIVAERYDAGVRRSDQIARDMVAVRIAPDLRMAVVGAPGYFAGRPKPRRPQDLAAHNCVNLRLSTYGGLYAWEFARAGKALEVPVQGQVICNTTPQMLTAALEGHGLAFVPEDIVQPHIEQGRLVRVLEEWCPSHTGYHLYYPSRRQPSPAFALVVETLRYDARRR